jgi:aldo/keto reductase family protein
VTLQNSYRPPSRNVDNDLAEVLFREEMSLLAYSPLAAGMLSGKYLGGSPANARLTLLDAMGMRFRKPMVREAIEAHVALAKKARALAGATRARLCEESLVRRRVDYRCDVDGSARGGHRRGAARARCRHARRLSRPSSSVIRTPRVEAHVRGAAQEASVAQISARIRRRRADHCP